MVHYIRFLKPPRLNRLNNLLSTMITITTDLGDAFYPGDVCVHIGVAHGAIMTSLGVASWKSGMRILKIEAKVPMDPSRFRFVFTSNESLRIDALQLGRLPEIVSAWTEEFLHSADLGSDVTLRRFRLPGGQVLEICEENGESMARHVWDGGVVLAAWLNSSLTIEQHIDDAPLSILELGTGCGTAGLAFSTRWSCHTILTDENDEALTFAKYNAQKFRNTYNNTWECHPLDWSQPQKYKLDRPLDFIVASECIYNPDSIPGLVRTISYLVRQSKGLKVAAPQPKVIISTKTRHPSEAAFFDLMTASGFEQSEHASITVPDSYRKSTGQDLEMVHIYVFELQIEIYHPTRESDRGGKGGFTTHLMYFLHASRWLSDARSSTLGELLRDSAWPQHDPLRSAPTLGEEGNHPCCNLQGGVLALGEDRETWRWKMSLFKIRPHALTETFSTTSLLLLKANSQGTPDLLDSSNNHPLFAPTPQLPHRKTPAVLPLHEEESRRPRPSTFASDIFKPP
ncbi:MAG: hypothetical protein Q9224_003815 [Gallowayella concinna]